MSKIQTGQYYDNNLNDIAYDNYKRTQIVRHSAKSYKKRDRAEYEVCFNQLKDLIQANSKMICLGTRNNHERDVFSELSKDIDLKVFSQDIAKTSNADFIGDFNNLSDFVTHDWDVIYSNSLDHAIDASNAFYEWLGVIKKGGIMILGFNFDDDVVGQTDCNSFSKNKLDEFMNDESDFKLIKYFRAIDYDYCMIEKT